MGLPLSDKGKKNPKSHKTDRRFYFIPQNLIQWDKDNIVCVRVYDFALTGGIYNGQIGIITRDNYMKYKNRKK